ncbi:MAG: hypothetical protein VX617_07215, partial [Pseudomonadota bacterium]|nr:hypothetical protein [Pseudomonadota bacterium]
LTLGESIFSILKQIKLIEGELRILHGDTLIQNYPYSKTDIISEGLTSDYYTWAEYSIFPDGKINFSDGLPEGPGENSMAGGRNVLSGFFSFSDAKLYLGSLKLAKYNFINSLNSYSDTRPLNPLNIGTWLDFGHLENYYQSKAKMTTERSFNEMDIARYTVQKSSNNDLKIDSELNWFKQLPSQLRIFTPHFLGEFSKGTSKGYETEHLYLSTLSDLSVFGRLPTYVWQRIFQSCDEFLVACGEHKPPHFDTASNQLYKDKTLERLEIYAKQSETSLDKNWYYDNTPIPSLKSITEEVALLIPSVKPKDLQVIHGDFCFSNIFYDFRPGSIKVVDPRGYTFGETASIYGDVRYDIAKLFQSAIGGYDHIVCGQHILKEEGKYRLSITMPAEPQLEETKHIFCDRTFAGYTISDASSHLISILLFLSMLPLHSDRPERQRAFLANALRLYTEFKS